VLSSKPYYHRQSSLSSFMMFEVPVAMVQNIVFWDVTACILIEGYWHCIANLSPYLSTWRKKKAVYSPETEQFLPDCVLSQMTAVCTVIDLCILRLRTQLTHTVVSKQSHSTFLEALVILSVHFCFFHTHTHTHTVWCFSLHSILLHILLPGCAGVWTGSNFSTGAAA